MKIAKLIDQGPSKTQRKAPEWKEIVPTGSHNPRSDHKGNWRRVEITQTPFNAPEMKVAKGRL